MRLTVIDWARVNWELNATFNDEARRQLPRSGETVCEALGG